MRRREFLQRIAAAGAGLAGGLVAARHVLATPAPRTDDAPYRDVLLPLLIHHQPRTAVTTAAGSVVIFAADGREIRLVDRLIPETVSVIARRDRVRWEYDGLRTGHGRVDLLLETYRTSVSPEIHERAASLSATDEAVRAWFEDHERQFRRIVALLSRRLRSGWSITAADVVRRAAALRAELDESIHVQAIPGESYRITITGATDDTERDRLDLAYDLVRDAYRLTFTGIPREPGTRHLAPHTEIFDLRGDGSGLIPRYRLERWIDRTVGITHTPGSGGAHPAYRAEEDRARQILSLFPRFV